MKQSVDEFLAAEAASTRLRAILEPVSDPALVRLTPLVRGDCACSEALVIPKAALSAVYPTDAEHYCCGKLLRVVIVEFADDARTLHSVLQQVMGRTQPDAAYSPRRAMRNAEDCQAGCADAYQSCLDGCDPRDGNCKYWCKQQLHRCLQGCQEPVPPAPPETIPTESCNITVNLANALFPNGGEIVNSANVSNQLILTGANPVRQATMDTFAIVGGDGTTSLDPSIGQFARNTGEISFPAWFDVKGKFSLGPTQVWVTTGAVSSPSGKYDNTGATLDWNTREFTLVSAGAIEPTIIGPIEYFIAVVATLSALPS